MSLFTRSKITVIFLKFRNATVVQGMLLNGKNSEWLATDLYDQLFDQNIRQSHLGKFENFWTCQTRRQVLQVSKYLSVYVREITLGGSLLYSKQHIASFFA